MPAVVHGLLVIIMDPEFVNYLKNIKLEFKEVCLMDGRMPIM